MRKISIGKYFIIVILSVVSTGLEAQEKHPNIVLIMADDLGFECISANGGTSYQTPFIDKLAEQGYRFENCHAQPLCTPSRVQVMTGQYNVRNYCAFGVLDRDQVSFGKLFQDAGYKTAVAGKWQLGKEKDSPQHFGFGQSCLWQQSLGRTNKSGHDTRFSNPVLEINGEVKRYTNGEFGPDIVSDFICDFMEENKEQPFLAYYPMILTHCPFIPTPDSEAWDPKDMGSLSYKGEPEYFTDMVSYMDKMVGKIVSKIDELGLSENTLILFTGDNGTDQPIVSMLRGKEYPGGKGSTKDNGTHVPLVVSWNGTIASEKECFDMIDFSDFLPTLCDAAGIKKPSDLQIDGVSFLPQLLGQKGKRKKWIYGWYSRDAKTEEVKEYARNTDYKLYKTGEFYDLVVDPFETKALSLNSLSKEEKRAYKLLIKALGIYEGAREIDN